MSYKEVKEFLGILKELECPETVDVDSFQYPDFPLTAQILRWLIIRCDSSFQIPLEIEVDQDRVFFLKAITDHMVLKYNLVLDARKLYMADGHAVRELLKIARLLTDAQNVWTNAAGRNMSVIEEDVKAKILAKVMDLQTFRKDEGKLAMSSADMSEMLRQEPDNHATRINALNMRLDPVKVDSALSESIIETEALANEYEQKFANIEFDKTNLEAKIKKREEELDRMQRRLHTIQKTKPTHLDESDKLEGELKELYSKYSVTFRTFFGLQNEVQKAQAVMDKKNNVGERYPGEDKIRLLQAPGSDVAVADDGFNEDPADGSEPENLGRNQVGAGSDEDDAILGVRPVNGAAEESSDDDF